MIHGALWIIINVLRDGDDEPSMPGYIDLDFDRMVAKVWSKQQLIGWDYLLKGRISSRWGMAQGIYYSVNTDTRDRKHFST